MKARAVGLLHRGKRMRNKTDSFSAIALLGLVVFGFYSTSKMPPPPPLSYFGPASFVNFVLSCLGLCALILLIRSLRGQQPPVEVKGVVGWHSLLFVLLFGGYVFLFLKIGYLIPTFLFLVLCPMLFGRRRLGWNILFSIGCTGAIWVIFQKLFKVPLP